MTGKEFDDQHVRGIISDALRNSRMSRRHPAEVVSDNLGNAVAKFHDKFTGAERDMVAQIRQALEEIAEGSR